MTAARSGPTYRVMISSTARDLPDHRKALEHACLRLSLLPRMMEHLPASDDDAIAASLALVDEADIYLGVFAFRYGHVPRGHDRSITEIEYDRAVERGIRRICFVMADDYALPARDVETGPGAEKITVLRGRVGKEWVVNFFRSPDDLRALAIHALGEAQARLDEAARKDVGEPSALAAARAYHYVAPFPAPPEPYIAHPYTLLQTPRLIGRREELNLLTEWATGRGLAAAARFLCLEAVGGLGKSALAWHWFREIAPQEMRPLAGRLWWSFYESDATWENFVTRALAYAARRPLPEIEKLPFPEREDWLLRVLDAEPFLLVLDGLERILVAYARGDASYLRDEEVARDGTTSSPRHPLRRTTDPRASAFLRELLGVRAARVLASSRLFPADLENVAGNPLPGAFRHRLPGLTDDDALDLWRAFGARAARESLLPLVERIGRHPLLLQVLAGEVARFREAPGDFGAWSKANPQFDPFSLDIADTAGARSHVLAYGLRGLPAAEARTLHVLAGFRMPVGFDTIKALLLRDRGEEGDPAKVPFGDLAALDQALTDLEDRGLVGWDPRANRYDLHPIVRGVVWSGLAEEGKRDVRETLRAHFEAVPMIEDWEKVESLGDLTPAIELFHSLIGLGLYENAFRLFRDRLEEATLYRLSAARQRVELLERFLPDGTEAPPRLSERVGQSWVLNSLALAYQHSGRPGFAAAFFRRAETIVRRQQNLRNLAVDLQNLSASLLLSGSLRAAVGAAAEALQLARKLEDRFWETVSLEHLGPALTARGSTDEAVTALCRSLRIFITLSDRQGEGVVSAYLAEIDVRKADAVAARRRADRAWELAGVQRVERDFISAARLQGTSALRLGDLSTAEECLQHALARARACDNVEEQLPALLALAELRLRQGDPIQARELLDQVSDPAERGPFPLFHADALNLLAEIEREAGDGAAATEAATGAYRVAWCDGPPFAYHWGLETARAHLAALGAGEPPMPPFDPAKFDPMPEVEIDPPDEFGAARAESDPPP